MTFTENLAELYRDVLLEDVIPFWTNHSIDMRCGGYFTCLDRKGDVFDTDKFVWLQGRQAWMYSKLYNEVDQNGEWLDIARLGAEFLRDHGMDDGGNFYFSLERSGKPLVQPYNIFSDCFAAMAFSEYARASGEDWAGELAVDTFRNIQKRAGNPKGQYSKAFPGTRPLVSLALPMITINLALELRSQIDDPGLDEAIQANMELVMGKLVDRDLGLIFENVSPDGSHPDTFDGRLVLPGHGIEAMWFIMDTARAQGKEELIEPAARAMLKQLEFGWDNEDGGIYYFMDSMGKPSEHLEWAQKLWWVHLEALVGTALAHELTGNELYLEWYQKIHEYAWDRFPDPDYGEWWGYLDRHGKLLIPLKGGKWKGCFHVPRAMFELWRIFERLGS
ncbi:MAG: AGE family epimerase/isomerase [Theionarchaea archaeon]|nr:AGE family epimerase/isomerase [Theionarchaea archaeon]